MPFRTGMLIDQFQDGQFVPMFHCVFSQVCFDLRVDSGDAFGSGSLVDALCIDGLDGCYSNVIGLSLPWLRKALKGRIMSCVSEA